MAVDHLKAVLYALERRRPLQAVLDSCGKLRHPLIESARQDRAQVAIVISFEVGEESLTCMEPVSDGGVRQPGEHRRRGGKPGLAEVGGQQPSSHVWFKARTGLSDTQVLPSFGGEQDLTRQPDREQQLAISRLDRIEKRCTQGSRRVFDALAKSLASFLWQAP